MLLPGAVLLSGVAGAAADRLLIAILVRVSNWSRSNG